MQSDAIEYSQLHPNLDVIRVRQQARNQASLLMANYSPTIQRTACELADRLTPSGHTPRAGELLPILLRELSDIDDPTAAALGGAWFSLYLYTMFADAQMDERYCATPTEIMTSAALLSTGLGELRKHVSGTQYEAEMENSIQQAISAQADDYIYSRLAQRDDQGARTTALKNMYLVALATGYAAKSSNGEPIVAFVKKLLLAVQYLDDITDRASDFLAGNYTVLLARANTSEVSKVTEHNLLELLVRTGALASTLADTHIALSQALLTIAMPLPGDKPAPILTYLSILLRQVDSVRTVVEAQMSSLQDGFPYSPIMRRELHDRLRSIAFSS